MSEYKCAPKVESQYNAPSVPRSSVVEARAGTLRLEQGLAERSIRVRQGDKHIDLSCFVKEGRTLQEMYLARHLQQVNSEFHREAFVIKEQALSSSNCTEIICRSCEMTIQSILPHQNSTNCSFVKQPKQYLMKHAEQCRKVCGTCGVSTRVLARDGHNAYQIEQHLRYCNEYSANLASYSKYVAATGTFEVTKPNCEKHEFNNCKALRDFVRRWLGGSDTANNKKYVLSSQRREELEVEVPGALQYFNEKRDEKREEEKKKKEEALTLPSYKCKVCHTIKKLTSQGAYRLRCSVCKNNKRINSNWVKVEEEESDKKPAAK